MIFFFFFVPVMLLMCLSGLNGFGLEYRGGLIRVLNSVPASFDSCVNYVAFAISSRVRPFLHGS